MTTAQQIIDAARVPLNDVGKDRYSDVDLLRYLNFFLRALKKKRADLFIGALGVAWLDLSPSSAMPTPDYTDQGIADYISGRAGMVDDETTEQSAAFFQMAAAQL